MTKTRDLADLGGGFIQAGTGAVQRTVESKLQDLINVADYGVVPSNTAEQNYNILQGLIRNLGTTRKTLYWPTGTYQLDVFNPNNCYIIGDDVTIEFTHNPAKSPVMGQFTDTEIRGFTFKSLEADLENQRCTASKSTFIDCKFIGWRNPTNQNAWGLYLDNDQERCRLVNCGFQDNTQADIAVVDGANCIVIDSCYAIDPVGDALVINCEPNTSADYNSVLISSCNIGLLMLLENGSGGTSNKSITVQNCDIATLKWDGASAVIQSCRIGAITGETDRFAGSLYATNSMGLGPNLIKDPYLMVNAFNQSQALSNNQIWYMQARAGSIVAGGRTLEDENGLRYFRLNGLEVSGVISYSLATALTVTPGATYCVAVTGRRKSGTAGDYVQILDIGGTTTTTLCRFFRQSNLSNDEFVTEVVFYTPVNSSINLNIRNAVNISTASVDIKSVTVHEVVFNGYNFDEMLQRYHRQFGPRSVVLPALPASNPADQTGLQVGDTVTVTGGKTYAWDGTALQPLW